MCYELHCHKLNCSQLTKRRARLLSRCGTRDEPEIIRYQLASSKSIKIVVIVTLASKGLFIPNEIGSKCEKVKEQVETRMHSSRMRTGRTLTVFPPPEKLETPQNWRPPPPKKLETTPRKIGDLPPEKLETPPSPPKNWRSPRKIGDPP